MALYRKKPLIVDAEQFLHGATAPRGVRNREDGSCYVVTIHGQETNVVSGDWIIEEPDKIHYYPCKPDVFAATYESVEEDFATWLAKPKADWRIGLTCKPKFRDHELRYETGQIIDVLPSGTGGISDRCGVLKIKMDSGRVLLAPSDHWVTA